MIIRFVGIWGYENIKKPINIDLGGPFSFELVGDKEPSLHVIKENNNYIYDLYKDITVTDSQTKKPRTFPGVSDISAIVGRNGSGKTTSLRLISTALRVDTILSITNNTSKIRYVIIQEDVEEKQLYISSNVARLVADKSLSRLNSELRELGYSKVLRVIPKEEMLKRINQVYFSSVYDKAPRFLPSDNLYDISTNYILNDFISSGRDISGIQAQKQEYYLRISTQQNLDDLRRNDVLDRLYFIDKYSHIEKDFLFEFPNEFTAFLVENLRKKNRYYLSKNAHALGKRVTDFKKNINEQLYRLNSTPGLLMDYFAVLILEDIMLTSLKETDLSIDDISSRCWYKLNRTKSTYKGLLTNYATELGFKPKDNPASDSYNGKSHINKLPREEDRGPEAYLEIIDEYLQELDEYKYLINDYNSNDLLIDEKFDDLRAIFRSCKSFFDSDLSERLEGILDSIYDEDGFIIYNIDEDQIKEDLLACIDDLIDEINDYRKAAKKDIFESTRQTYEELNQELVSFEQQETQEVFKADIYENLDAKIDFMIELYDLFCKTCDSAGSEVKDADLHVCLRNPNGTKTESRDYFLKFCTMYVENRNKPYPKGIEIFALITDHEPISSGYNGYFDMLTRLASIAEDINKTSKKDLLLLLDEAELYLHPEAQREFILSLLKVVNHLFKGKDIQLVLASNSPFILSDVQHSNTMYLKEFKAPNGLTPWPKKDEEKPSPFGTNISTLLMNGFFMPDGAIGAFARIEINNLIKRIASDNYQDRTGEDKKLIKILGDELISEKLREVYCEKMGITVDEFLGA
jgi:energy-coupling factor transporter ATP-binding protein EcfA2